MNSRFSLSYNIQQSDAHLYLYPVIRKTITLLQKRGYTKREASVLGWRKRRLLIRRFIKNCRQHIDETLVEMADEDEENTSTDEDEDVEE